MESRRTHRGDERGWRVRGDWAEDELRERGRERHGHASYPFGYDEDFDASRGRTDTMQGRRDWERGIGSRGGSYGERPWGERSHRGVGPKNYRRSDERIHEDVCELLTDSEVDASEIEVNVRDGEVTLVGTVEDRWSKREAEDVTCMARGVRDCHNQIRIDRGRGETARGNGRPHGGVTQTGVR